MQEGTTSPATKGRPALTEEIVLARSERMSMPETPATQSGLAGRRPASRPSKRVPITRALLASLVLAAALLVGACGGGGESGPPPGAPDPPERFEPGVSPAEAPDRFDPFETE